MKTIVYYYSNMGSNRFLANKIANDLGAEIEEIRPRLNIHLLMIMGLNLGNRKLESKVEEYDNIILCGPIWMGKLIIPLKNFVKQYSNKFSRLTFVSCCGSSFEGKDEKFGHNLVFNQLSNIIGEKCIQCQAFPITLVLPEEQKDETSAFMHTHLNDENFKGEIASLYDTFITNYKMQI
jgi:flavodoxin